MLITMPVLVFPRTIFTERASHCFNILIDWQQTIKSCLICQITYWVHRRTSSSYYTKFTPVGAVKSHYPIKAINSGVAKLQAHPVKMCNKWLKFVNDVNYGSLKETVTRVSKWAAYHQESSEQMPSVPITSILLSLMNESINSPAMELLSIVWWLCRELSRTLIPVKSR